MAENENQDPEGVGEGEPKPKSRAPKLLGGVVGLVALAYAVSLMALPKAEKKLNFDGPFVAAVTEEKISVNLAGDSGKRYLAMELKAEFDAYDEDYVWKRVADPLYQAQLQDALIRVSSQKTKNEITDRVGKDVFAQEIRDAVSPLLFPVHVGNEMDAHKAHEESGLRTGPSMRNSTLRGGFHSHVLHVDVPGRTLRLDEGPETAFRGDETDFVVGDGAGSRIYLDLTMVQPDFQGEVKVGTFGSIRDIYFARFLIQ
jgi:flagellar basal body-associated protein FliL